MLEVSSWRKHAQEKVHSRVKSSAVTKSHPYIVNVRDLVHRPGELRDRRIDLDAPEHLGEGMVAVRELEPLRIDLRLESLHEGILATGDIVTEAHGECARCLKPVTVPVEVEFAELFAYPADEPFDYELHGDQLDLEPVVRDAVVLSLPFQPECADGCDEVELRPGITLVTDEAPAEPDARWAALQSLRFDEAARVEAARVESDASAPGRTA